MPYIIGYINVFFFLVNSFIEWNSSNLKQSTMSDYESSFAVYVYYFSNWWSPL